MLLVLILFIDENTCLKIKFVGQRHKILSLYFFYFLIMYNYQVNKINLK